MHKTKYEFLCPIESTISSIQSNQQERIKRKANLEATIKQTAARLERAQLLSYSLEEESERWKANLIEVDKSLQVLVGNAVIVVRFRGRYISKNTALRHRNFAPAKS